MSKKELVVISNDVIDILFKDEIVVFYDDGTYKGSFYESSDCSYWKIENNTLYYRHDLLSDWDEWFPLKERIKIIDRMSSKIVDNMLRDKDHK